MEQALKDMFIVFAYTRKESSMHSKFAYRITDYNKELIKLKANDNKGETVFVSPSDFNLNFSKVAINYYRPECE